MLHDPSPAAGLAAALGACAEAVCRRYLPHGRKHGRYWIAGDLDGARGRSLFVRLHGPGVPGKWTDAATGQHGDLLDLIRHRTGAMTLRAALDEARAFLALPVAPVPGSDGSYDATEAARRLWRQCRAIGGTHAERYLQARGLSRCRFATLRFHPELRYREGSSVRRFPALVAAVTGNDGALLGVQRTWLDPRRPAKDYASYCTSLVRSGAYSGVRCRCFRPRCLVGGCSGISNRQWACFGVRVRKSGRKNYVVQTRVAGKLRWFTIGQHGPITLEQARAAALEILALAKKGIDPRDDDATRAAEPVMADLGKRFLEDYVPVHCKPSTREEYRRSVTLFIDPEIGEMRVSEVQRKDIAELHHGLRDKPYQANRTLGVLSKMFSLAEVWGWRPDGSNPCRHVKRYKERKRERFLSPEETERLGEILREAEDEMPSAVAAIRLLLLTGCRLSEIQFLRWEYVKGDCIELPDAKTGGRIVPLGPEARAVLSALPREDDNPWVIAGKLPGTHLTDLQRPWRRIRARADLEDVRIHDLRHSFASRALALGESLTMIGKLLGHTQVQTTARYAHLARDSIQTAAARITGSIGGNLLAKPAERLDRPRN